MKRGIALAIGLAVVLAVAVAAVAAGGGGVQANSPQVAGDPLSNSTARFPTNKQNEPTIAVSPIDGTHLIAASNDEQLQPACGPGPVRGATAARNDCSFYPNVGTDGVYTSSDGGATWTNRGLLPGFSDGSGAANQLVSDGDPVIVYGPRPNGNGGFTFAQGTRAYYASLASYNTSARQGHQAPELLTVSTSEDNGVAWSNPVIAVSGQGFTFNDKEAIWVDKNPRSAYFGRVYVSWTQFRGIPGCAEPVMFAYSGDGGATWSRPNQITAAHNCGLGGRQGSVIRTGPDGSVYLQWEDTDQSGPIQAVAVSRDGGATFSKPSAIANVTDLAAAIPGSNFRTDSFASMGVDQTSGGVYVAWADAATGTGTIVVYKSTDGAASWKKVYTSSGNEGYRFYQGLDVSPTGRVDIGYQALTAKNSSVAGTGNAQVAAYYVGSKDGGATWSRPTRISAFSDPAASAQNNLQLQFWGDYNTLVSTSSTAWFIYTDARNGVGCPAVDAYQAGTAAKPAPEDVCPAQFGNTDAYVSTIAP
jgi:Neuraminidase (sialidase)